MHGYPALLSAISPDERYAPIVVTGSSPEFGVVDLGTGEFTPLAGVPQSSLWWAPDSHAVLYLVDDRLMMYDFRRDVAFEAMPGSTMSAFAVRPPG
jgi:hypothetical protein